ncbi:MAG: carbon-nitrogen hydrolase family protein [Verrucomicrobiales bacterium]|nr:carbon-nitrogen hydrolase family protein [Verrucomicrobiales bacterium]
MKIVLCCLFLIPVLVQAEWTSDAPREEIAPVFEQKDDLLILKSPGNTGTNGHWRKTFPVTGGKPWQFTAMRKATGIEIPRRSCVVRIEWEGKNGKNVYSSEEVNPAYFGNDRTYARPEYPKDVDPGNDGWVKVQGTYLAPEDAVQARVKLILRWTENGSVAWKDVSFSEAEALPERKVVLAAVHHNIPGKRKTPSENRALFEPLIAEAAAKGADLIVLPELLTCKGVTHDYASVAEPVPGPTTEFFGELSRKHDCYIVSGLTERDGKQVYNVAVLTGPDGAVVGKYRKVTLPREEIERGISPGKEYPVFETRFGKVGMMICYDVFFPEVARELAANGAEIIALPIWGGNPGLASARCAENGVYLVSSTYTDHNANWMKSAIWNREGNRIAEGKQWGSVVTAEVDLNKRTYWHGLGDFQARIAREAPVRISEAAK